MTNNLIENFEDLNHMINLNKLNSLILINNPMEMEILTPMISTLTATLLVPNW